MDHLFGYEETVTTVGEREDIAASLGRLTPETARYGIAGAVALGLLLSAETGYVSPLAVSTVVALVLHVVGELPDPEPVAKTHKVERHGLPERKVMRYLTMSNEYQKMENEAKEEARRKAERQSKNG